MRRLALGRVTRFFWVKENQVRLLLVIGILLSLVAYLLFVSGCGAILAILTAAGALATSFYGLWSWNVYQADAAKSEDE